MKGSYNLSHGFLFMYDWLPMIERLSGEEFKALFLALVDRQRNGTPIPHLDGELTQIFASMIEPTIIRRLEGQKGGLKRTAKQASPKIPVEASIEAPTVVPTVVPTEVPIEVPTVVPTEVPIEVPIEVPTEVPAQPSKAKQSRAKQSRAKQSRAMSPSEAQLPKGQPAPVGAGTSAQARERQKQKWIDLGFDEKNFDTDDFFTAALRLSYGGKERNVGTGERGETIGNDRETF